MRKDYFTHLRVVEELYGRPDVLSPPISNDSNSVLTSEDRVLPSIY